MLSWLIGTNGDWTISIARIVLGVVFFAHGAQKALGWFGGAGLGNTLRIFRQNLRIPAPLGLLAVAAEFLGGIGLVLGVLSRLAALGIAVVMCIAILSVHGKFGLFLNWYGEKQGHGIEYHILALALALIVIVKGAGAFSVDHAVYRHFVGPNGTFLGINLERGQ